VWCEDAEVTAGGSSGSVSAGPGRRATENKHSTVIGACLAFRVNAPTGEEEEEEEEKEEEEEDEEKQRSVG
jgi:hypothetical protein